MIGLLYWAVYAFCPYFLIIDYARIAVAASYLIMIVIGLGAAEIFNFLKNKYPVLNKENFRFSLAIIILAIFVALSFFYTRRTNWKNIILKYDTPAGVIEGPIYAPVNNYLNQDDLALFKGISQKRFLSIPWKALVIGAATNNYPLDSKAGIITNSLMDYDEFISTPCEGKIILAQNVALDYVYSAPFNCLNFTPLGSSREGLYLYKFQP